MNAQAIVDELARRGVRLRVENGRIIARPLSAIPSNLAQAVRVHKREVLALLCTSPDAVRAHWTRSVTPDSRHPLMPSEVRTKIEAIEAEARAKGWPAELLWNSDFWDCPRGLAAVLNAEDEIAEVSKDYIAILKVRRDLLKFRRHAA
jgi:TubC N-terminal docking domain